MSGPVDELVLAAQRLLAAARPFALGGNPCACGGPPGDCPCVRAAQRRVEVLALAIVSAEPVVARYAPPAPDPVEPQPCTCSRVAAVLGALHWKSSECDPDAERSGT